MSTLESWTEMIWADISGQLRRLEVHESNFDGLGLSKTSFTGRWLLDELVCRIEMCIILSLTDNFTGVKVHPP